MKMTNSIWDLCRPFIGLIIAFSIITLIAVFTYSIVVDDAYISLRYAVNLISGQGLVFNPGETVEGITNIGWTLFLIPFIKVLGSIPALKTVGLLLTLATLFLFNRINSACDEDGYRRFGAFAAVILATQLDFIFFP